jgi:hypothetical protein
MDAAEERWPLARGSADMREPLRDLLTRTDGAPRGCVLFVSGANGYEIVEWDEEPPPVDALVALPGGSYRVTAVRRSPFPGDRRPCLTVQPS